MSMETENFKEDTKWIESIKEEFDLSFASNNFSWKRYSRGRYREYRVAEFLMKQGFNVFRSIKSLGPFDLITLRPGYVLFAFQVKMRRRPNIAIPQDYDLERAKEEAKRLGMAFYFVGNTSEGHLTFWLWRVPEQKWIESTAFFTS